MKRLLCAVAAFLIFGCGVVSADFLQIADEAAVRLEDSGPAEDMLDYVYASGAVQDPDGETRRLYIWSYLLNIRRAKLAVAQNFCTNVYETMNRDGELDYLSEQAYEYARQSNEIQSEIERGEGYLDRLDNSDKTIARAERMAAEFNEEETEDSGILRFVPLFLLAVLVILVMILLGFRARAGVRGMRLRDIRRALLRLRYVILAAGVICAMIAAPFVRPAEVVVDSAFPPLPDTDGEYILAVEALLSYCDEITAIDGALADRVENVRRYQLSSAMGEILNDRVAKNMDDLIAEYSSRAENLRGEIRRLSSGYWQAHESAVNGPEEKYAAMVQTYMEQGIEAQQLQIDVDYCENIISLMELDGPVKENADVRTEEFIRAAEERLSEITAPTVPYEPVLPYETAAILGFVLGIVIAALAVILAALLRLSLRKRAEQKQVANSPYRELMESINSRG